MNSEHLMTIKYALANSKKLRSLNLSNNELKDAGALILSEIFSPSQLNTFIVPSIEKTLHPSIQIEQIFEYNPSRIQKLNISNNQITEFGMVRFLLS